MRFRLLGPLGAETSEGPIDLGPHKQRTVLAVLLLHANEIVSTDRIVDLVWGDSPPRTADHSVQIYISDLRKALANGASADVIETRPPGYVLNAPPDSVDALRFQQLVRDGLAAVRTGDVAGGRPKLEKALSLWTSSPLSDFAYEEFAQGFIRSLEELRSDALEALALLELDQGNYDRARERARLAIEADSLREEPRRLMMLALYRSGRQAEALRHFGEYRDSLVEELGIEPSSSLRDLEERILLQDPSLAALPTVTTEGNPYRGLRPFSEEDADVYFGRESLVEEVLDRLRDGSGFVSIVGPSGSGKSSAARAGAMPGLREEGNTVVAFQPGSRPLWELAGAVDRAGFGSRAGLLRRFENDADSLKAVIDRPVVLVVDQFEELFTLAEPDVALRFSELIARAILAHGTPMRVVATLRADYYDKPLSVPALAGVFSDSVVSVKPMTPLEVERAVIEPARAAGVPVEPSLLAQLIADMGDEPGALPLLQVTLFELFERCDDRLTLAEYEALGGLHGALTKGADELLDEFDVEGRDLVEQVMMRMVQKGRTMSTARPVALRDLLALGIDSVVLQGVLEAFGSRRLITFDRDASGAAVIEIAHEYLIAEWPQLAEWIEEHSDDLDRLYALDTSVDEWLDADRSEDYLLRGDRLDRFEAWSNETSLRLTSRETEFLDTSVLLRDQLEAERADREAEQLALTRKARFRLRAFGVTIAALAAVGTFLVMILLPDPPPEAIVWYQGRVGIFGEMIGAGIDDAVAETGMVIHEYTRESDSEHIRSLMERGTNMLIVDFSFALASGEHPAEWLPEANFVMVDCDPSSGLEAPPNASCISLNNAEVGFLAGVAAGLATETGTVGYLGGVDLLVIRQMEAGFKAGVAHVNPSIEVMSVYLSGLRGNAFDLTGFSAPALARLAGEYLYRSGSDVVFQAAGRSGAGLFVEAAEFSDENGTHVWAIGVDGDEYLTIDFHTQMWPMTFDELEPEEFVAFAEGELDSWKSHILTSAMKLTSAGVTEALVNFHQTGSPGEVLLGLNNGGVGYSTSGGHIEPYVPQMDSAIQAVLRGDVTFDVDYESPVVQLEDLITLPTD